MGQQQASIANTREVIRYDDQMRHKHLVFGYMKRFKNITLISDERKKPKLIYGFVALNQYATIAMLNDHQIDTELLNSISLLVLLYYHEKEEFQENERECFIVEKLYDQIHNDLLSLISRSPSPCLWDITQKIMETVSQKTENSQRSNNKMERPIFHEHDTNHLMPFNYRPNINREKISDRNKSFVQVNDDWWISPEYSPQANYPMTPSDDIDRELFS